jgi:hypothetical protein
MEETRKPGFAIYVHWPIAEYVNIMAAVIW